MPDTDAVYHYAAVADGRVVGTLTGILPTPPPGYLRAHADVRHGWLHDGKTFTEPGEDDAPADPRSEALATIADLTGSDDPELASLAKAVQTLLGQ